MKEGGLRVWWIPQVPMKPFCTDVSSAKEGKKILDTLAFYEIFQYENNVKGDYCNMGGLEVYENGEWIEWKSEDLLEIHEVDFESTTHPKRKVFGNGIR